MKILSIFGTRPEAIKMAPLVKALSKERELETKVCVTAQHREMLDQVLQLFEIIPDYDLNLMRAGQDLSDLTSGILIALRDVLKDFQPDLVLVHGDTTTCFVATLAAFYQQIPVGHVEAGLRTGNLLSPWPEEANRVLTTVLARWHFAPTHRNQQALINEGVKPERILVTGNTVVDALKLIVQRINGSSGLKNKVHNSLVLAGLSDNIWQERFILITGHRRENFGQGFENICHALTDLANRNPDTQFIYPVHLNPNVLDPVSRLLSGLNNVHLIQPLDYASFIYMMQHCYLVLTDSGGIQEEAPCLGKPVLVMRDTTERPEAVETGIVKLIGTDVSLIIQEVQSLLDDKLIYKQMRQAQNPYGNGTASQRIVDYIKRLKENK